MTRRSLKKLVQILDPFLHRAEWNSSCLEHILIEHIVTIGLRVLSDGRTKDQCHIAGTSLDAMYKAADDFIDAVNAAPELDTKMPQSDEEWDRINASFTKKSTHEIISGCVGALDGFSSIPTSQQKRKSSMCYRIILVTTNLMESIVKPVSTAIWSLCTSELSLQGRQTTIYHFQWHQDSEKFLNHFL